MIVKKIENRQEWENFLHLVAEKTFLQSWDWGEFQISLGRKIWRWGIYENDELVGTGLVIKNPIIKIGRYRRNFLFCPHGPVVLNDDLNFRRLLLESFLEKLKTLAKQEKAAFIRLAPFWEASQKDQSLFQPLGLKPAPMFIHPELTWELNLLPAEDELLKGMRKTTRYLIRKALKWPDLRIEQGTDLEDLKYFRQLYQETVDHHHFIPFSKNYLEKEISSFCPNQEVSIFSAFWKNELLASAIIIFWQGIAFYHHGASSPKHSKIPGAYFLQWKIIQEAKKRGCQIYNFWGIAPSISRKHPWGGLTLFKRGFGGRAKLYVKTQDLPLSWLYGLNWLLEKIRRIRRKV